MSNRNSLISGTAHRTSRFSNISISGRKSSRSATLSFKIIATVLLLSTSILCGVIIVEFLYHVYTILESSKQRDQYITMNLFGGDGYIFRSIDDIFTYSPNKDIQRLATYVSANNFGIEYDYHFHTNNFGLVQATDIYPNINSMLLLGDSFTEGVGATPWFRDVAGEISNLGYQPINGGLFGTGFAHWSKLATYLTLKSIQIEKIVVLFISDDYIRGIGNASGRLSECFAPAFRCRGDEGLYRLPPMEELSSWAGQIYSRRQALFSERMMKLMPASYRVYDVVKTRAVPGVHSALNAYQSDAAIAALIEKYRSANVTFIHLPQNNEMDGSHRFGLDARRSIERSGGRLYDGFKLCGLTSSDYHIHDGHPNEKGYAKIALCTGRIIKQQQGLQP